MDKSQFSRDLFNTLGAPLLHGGLWPENYDLGRNFGVILSYDLWKRRFGDDPNVLGRKITLDAAPFYVIHGVAPQGLSFPGDVQLFRSIAINDRMPNYKDRDARNVYAVARLKPGVSFERARAELDAFSRRMAERAWPNQDPIGKRLKVGGVNSQSKWTTIVGVVGDVKHEEIAGEGGLDLYVSYQQWETATCTSCCARRSLR